MLIPITPSFNYEHIYIYTYSLHFHCKIWRNTPNSLIDFESDENVSLSKTISTKGSLYQRGSTLHFIPSPLKESFTRKETTNEDKPKAVSDTQNGYFICKLCPKKDIYEIELGDTKNEVYYDIDDIPWIIVKYVFDDDNDNAAYHLHEGDLLKMGKFILKIRQIRVKGETTTIMKTMLFDTHDKNISKYEEEDLSRNILNNNNNHKETHDCLFKEASFIKNSNLLLLNQKTKEEQQNYSIDYRIEDKPTCRICLSDEYDDFNPLINPCKCSGTMKYLHLNCLKQLMQSKVTKVIGKAVTVLTFKTLDCDICKSPFPENIKIKNRVYTVIDLNRPANNYVIIEGIVKETPDIKLIFVISFKDKQQYIKIGRASDADVRLSDISVSRSHACLYVYNGNCLLRDTKSKFGTLVSAGHKLCVIPGKPLYIQKGNYFMKFMLKLKLCSFCACYKPKHLPYKNYNSYLKTVKHCKYQLKDVPNFLWTDTQIVNGYEDLDISSIKKENEIQRFQSNNLQNNSLLNQISSVHFRNNKQQSNNEEGNNRTNNVNGNVNGNNGSSSNNGVNCDTKNVTRKITLNNQNK